MSLPYFPMYVDDFEADTAHLTIEEDGAYNRLLRLCWRTPGCSVPDDAKWIMRKMRVSADDYYRVVEPIIDEYFTRGMGRIFSPRLQREHDRTQTLHEQKSRAGKASAKARALKTKETKPNSVDVPLQQPEPEPEPYTQETSVSCVPRKPPKRKTRLREDAEITDGMRRAAEKRGHSQQEAEAQFQKFKNDALAKGKTFVEWDRAFVTWLDSPYFRPITTSNSKDGSAAARAQRIGERYAAKLSCDLDSGPD